MATDSATDDLVGFAVGESIGEIVIRSAKIDGVPLEQFTSSAYLGYDETIARHLRRIGEP